MLYGERGEVPTGEFLLPIGEAEVKVEGTDVTLIAHSRMAHVLMNSVDAFAKENISIELVDPRTIKPFDIETVARSVAKTHRVVIMEEGHRFCGVGAEFADQIYTRCFDALDAPIVRVTHTENPLPYAKNLEAASLPTVEDVMRACKSVLYRT